MSNNFRRCIIGAVYGLILSLICSFLIANGIAMVIGGRAYYDSLWIFLASCVPCTISFSISGYFFTFKDLSKVKYWLACMVIGFINVLYMGTIGAIMASSIMYSTGNINIGGYLASGPVYAILSLPLFTLFAAGLLKGLRNVLVNKDLL